MKTSFFTIFIAVSQFLSAQLTITTDFREEGSLDKNTEDWIINYTEEGLTVFNFNEELTWFRHITESMSSTYVILDWDYDEENVQYEMSIVSDVGNEYDLLIDGITASVILLSQDDSGVYQMVRHSIKDTYFDE